MKCKNILVYSLVSIIFLLTLGGCAFKIFNFNKDSETIMSSQSEDSLLENTVSNIGEINKDRITLQETNPIENDVFVLETQPIEDENSFVKVYEQSIKNETTFPEMNLVENEPSSSEAPPTEDESSSPETSTTENEPSIPEVPPTENEDINYILSQMTLKEKIGQLFIIRPDPLDTTQTSGVTKFTDSVAYVLNKYPVGGIAMFYRNIEGPEHIVKFIELLQNSSDIPMFMAIDEEGGIVARIGNHSAFDVKQYESAQAVGESGNPADALEMGNTIGAYLRKYSFNMDFAPVADVNTNPDNPVIGCRAFSSDANIASQMANAMAQGLKQQNIIPVFKHFPGHGDTGEDSHSGIAISYKTKEEMEICEWLPYKSLTKQDCVMVGHIATPNITGDLTPATMSSKVVNGILRQHLGFDGLVITDSLGMGAVTNEHTSEEIARGVIEAGCDVLLCPYDFETSFNSLLSNVENGTISEQRIDESVHRVLELKKAYGILK